MTLLPSHSNVTMRDPLSVVEKDWDQEEVSKWKLISTLLFRTSPAPPPSHPDKALVSHARPSQPIQQERLTDETNWKTLEDIITTLQPGLSSCDTLKSVVMGDSQECSHFFQHTFPAMVLLALRMPEIFPSGVIPFLHPGRDSKVSFTREQIACLLVHMFLCTFQPAPWNKFWVNFHVWFSSHSRPVIAYLQSLLAYFKQLDPGGRPPYAYEIVTFERCVLHCKPKWEDSKAELFQIKASNSIETLSSIEVDFANKDVGFGVSGSQEEAKLAQSPETCIVMLLAPTLQDNEALIIQGAQKN